MSLKSLTICGFRGFAEKQTLRFAKPTCQIGSGLTILVGPNNGGKSTVMESLNALLGSAGTPSFSEGKRNARADGIVSIKAEFDDGETHELVTGDTRGSETTRRSNAQLSHICYFLPSRRFFNPYFGSGEQTRAGYIGSQSFGEIRSQPIDQFSRRLFAVDQNRSKFDEVFAKVMTPIPDWAIELSDQGGYYLKIKSSTQSHSSDGLGEGVVSLLFLVDALYDSEPGDIIVVDEPELSLHPQFQRRLLRLFASYAKDRQIVFATHSPLFADFEHIINGGEVARVHKIDGASIISQVGRQTAEDLAGIFRDSNNPHVLGLNAREALFQEDGIVLLEGQEDVVLYPRVLDQLVASQCFSEHFATDLKDRFFGWGAGGAGKFDRIIALLRDLGFRRVAGIVDKDKEHTLNDLRQEFPEYTFGAIPSDDVRTKPKRAQEGPTKGLLDEKRTIRPEFKAQTAALFAGVGNYMHQDCDTSA